MFEVHFWKDGKNKGRVSCLLSSRQDAERWISEWKSVAVRFENDDLRIHEAA